MARNYSWAARVNGRTIADGTASGNADLTAEAVKKDATSRVALRAAIHPRDITVTVTEK